MNRDPKLAGQTLVVIGGSAGIGLETARVACEHGAHVILTARDPERVHRVGLELGASIAAFDATDLDRLARFVRALPTTIEHLLVSAPSPITAQLSALDVDETHVDAHLDVPLQVARNVAGAVRPGGSVLFLGCIDGSSEAEPGSVTARAAALRRMTEVLALELAPTRVNVIAAGFVDTPRSAAILGDRLDARREELRSTLPIRRVVVPADVAALAVHLMTNTAITGATFEIDGGQQLVER